MSPSVRAPATPLSAAASTGAPPPNYATAFDIHRYDICAFWMKYSERRKLKVGWKLEINEVNNQIVSRLQEIEARSGL